jgi:hypothetical protein
MHRDSGVEFSGRLAHVADRVASDRASRVAFGAIDVAEHASPLRAPRRCEPGTLDLGLEFISAVRQGDLRTRTARCADDHPVDQRSGYIGSAAIDLGMEFADVVAAPTRPTDDSAVPMAGHHNVVGKRVASKGPAEPTRMPT